MKELEGNIAIVTGGARGIGEGICKVFCNEGATVFLWDILDEGELTAKKIKEDGGDIFYQKVVSYDPMGYIAKVEAVQDQKLIDSPYEF